MLIPFGILSAAGSGGGGYSSIDAYELIQTQVLGSQASTVTFSSLETYASTYKDLEIRMTAKATFGSNTRGGLGVRINGNTGNNYSFSGLFVDESVVRSFGGGSRESGGFGEIPFGPAEGTEVGACFLRIADAYNTTKNTTMSGLGGYANIANFSRGILASTAFYNTAAVSSITISAGINFFYPNSRFSIYGIKG